MEPKWKVNQSLRQINDKGETLASTRPRQKPTQETKDAPE